MAVQYALAEIGPPPRDRPAMKRIRKLFLDHADRLVGPDAPIRASIEKARAERR